MIYFQNENKREYLFVFLLVIKIIMSYNPNYRFKNQNNYYTHNFLNLVYTPL